jgi:phage shock protein PspC (stress-responsive transcriptional regulator)
MQKVITINLNGRAYQLEEAAYDALRAYLNLAELRLKDNPDRAEILADFEQAIAEKCGRFLGPHKSVVTAAEMDQIVKEMGPVEGSASAQAPGHETTTAGESPAGTGTGSGKGTQKRLYRIREGQMVAGVCNGLAAYLDIDPAFVRIPFLLLSWTGVGAIAYFALMIIIPYAETSEQHAAAYGQPFNAQELIDQARKTAADFKSTADVTSREWKRQWREQRRQWRSKHREWRRQWRAGISASRMWVPPVASPPGGYTAFVGLMMPIFSLISLTLFVVLAITIWSLVTTGAIYGWPLPAGLPPWAGILIVAVLFQIVTSPIRAARHASYYAWGRDYGWFAAWDGLFATAVGILGIWLLYTHMPPVHDLREFMHNVNDAFRSLGRELGAWLQNLADRLREG